ncbi:MAG: NAD(+)/NADH kinase [Fidelibacterota bacterium]
MKISLHLHPERKKVKTILPGIIDYLNVNGHQVFICEKDRNLCRNYDVILLKGIEECVSIPVDLVISIGGDGTFIGAARLIAGTEIPIIGLHSGGLGFLAEVLLENFETKLNEFFKGHYSIEKRKILETEIVYPNHSKKYNSINDILIHRNQTIGMCKFITYVDGDFLNTYRGDGLIISTPSGSTAYNMSAGGPIILPHLDIITLTPICPHSLSARPIIIGGDQVVSFQLEKNRNVLALDIDGQERVLLESAIKVNIKNSSHSLNVVRFDDYSFFKTLQTKLNWGVDKRNEN